MTFITLLVITVLCLAIPFTRLYSVIGSVALLYFYPLPTLAVLLVAAGAFYEYHRRKTT